MKSLIRRRRIMLFIGLIMFAGILNPPTINTQDIGYTLVSIILVLIPYLGAALISWSLIDK